MSAQLRQWRPRRSVATEAKAAPAAQTFAARAQLDRSTYVGLGWLGGFCALYYGLPAESKTRATIALADTMRAAGLPAILVGGVSVCMSRQLLLWCSHSRRLACLECLLGAQLHSLVYPNVCNHTF